MCIHYIALFMWPIDCIVMGHRLPIACLLIAHAHDVIQRRHQGMPMTWAKTWVLLKAAGAERAAFSKAHVLAHAMSMPLPMPWLT